MNMILKILAALTAAPMMVIGLAWVAMPAKAAEFIKMPLMEGEALGSQIADGGTMFLSIGLMTIAGLLTGKRVLLQIPALMFLGIAFLRVVAHLVHGAALTSEFVGIEVISAAILWMAAKRVATS